MAHVPLEQLLDKAGGSIYKLVNLVSRRALEIAEGQPKLVDSDSAAKPVTIAFHEVACGKVQYKKAKSS